MIKNIKEIKLAVIGLGYVGLPLALEFAKKRSVIGYDLNKDRIEELNSGLDKNKEFDKNDFEKANKLKFTNNIENLKTANCYIVTVPTPIDKFKKPNLNPLIRATKMIGNIIKKNDLIIYESTVYPGCVEEICVPIIETKSGLKFNKNFLWI